MARKMLSLRRFYGGRSTDQKEGAKGTYWYARHIDHRKNPSKFSILPKTRKESGGNIDQLVQCFVQDTTGVIWALGEGGAIYKRNTSKVWSKFGDLSTTNGAYGMAYREDLDKIFITQTDRVSEIDKVTNTPVLRASKYNTSVSTDSSSTRTGGTSTLTLATALDESKRMTFTSDIEPLYSIWFYVYTKGTGSVTVVLHDGENNTLGTATITNGNLTVGWNEFVFASPIRILVKPNARQYHAHVYSSASDTILECATSGDYETLDFKISASRLIQTRNGMHPATTFNQYVAIGNGRYVSTTEALSDTPSNSEWERHKITLPPGYEVCGLQQWNEYLAIAAEKVTTQTNGTQFQDGKIFFWDGVSRTYNYYIDVPEGSPYSLSCHEQVLKYVAGGALYAYSGGRPVKLHTFRNSDSEYTDTTDYTVNYPNMMTVRRGVHLIGYASRTTNQALECGVYSYGAISVEYPNSFGYSYSISTGTRYNTAGTLRIGAIANFGDTLLIAWRDGTAYGIDVVDNESDPFAEARLETLRFDDEKPYKKKRALTLIITFEPLPDGATVQGEYTLDSGTPVQGNAVSTLGATVANVPIPQADSKRLFKHLDLAVNLTATTATPYITGIFLEYDDNTEQGKVRYDE